MTSYILSEQRHLRWTLEPQCKWCSRCLFRFHTFTLFSYILEIDHDQESLFLPVFAILDQCFNSINSECVENALKFVFTLADVQQNDRMITLFYSEDFE